MISLRFGVDRNTLAAGMCAYAVDRHVHCVSAPRSSTARINFKKKETLMNRFVSFAAVSCITACAMSSGPTEQEEATQSAVASCSPVYNQCGGVNWTGATCCASGNYCQYENPYYSMCRPNVSGGSTADNGQCPQSGGQDPQMRAAASVAFDMMKLSAQGSVTQVNAYWVYSILAAQRYRVASSGKTIEFDPNDPYYGHVTSAMKAKLAIAQLDSSVGQFLVAGLKYGYATTDGWEYPSIPAIQGLDGYAYPGPKSNPLLDHSAGDSVVIKGKPWCQTQAVSFVQTCMNSHNYAPLIMHDIRDWRTAPPAAFTGPAHLPSSPFNGNTAAGNPYLIVSVNGQITTWQAYSFAGTDCYALPNSTCTGTLLVDPIPYTQPGAYYDPSGNSVGPQTNPYALAVTNLYADPSHAGQWATRTVSGVQQWGTFSTPISVLGTTVYQYVKKM